MLPARVLARAVEANKSFLRSVSSTYAFWVIMAKRASEEEGMERCGESMETRTAAPSDPPGMVWVEAK